MLSAKNKARLYSSWPIIMALAMITWIWPNFWLNAVFGTAHFVVILVAAVTMTIVLMLWMVTLALPVVPFLTGKFFDDWFVKRSWRFTRTRLGWSKNILKRYREARLWTGGIALAMYTLLSLGMCFVDSLKDVGPDGLNLPSIWVIGAQLIAIGLVLVVYAVTLLPILIAMLLKAHRDKEKELWRKARQQ